MRPSSSAPSTPINLMKRARTAGSQRRAVQPPMKLTLGSGKAAHGGRVVSEAFCEIVQGDDLSAHLGRRLRPPGLHVGHASGNLLDEALLKRADKFLDELVWMAPSDAAADWSR